MSEQQKDNFPLDETAITLLADLARAEQQLQTQAVALNAQRNGVLVYFIRQHKLLGNWKLAENGLELEKVQEPTAQEQPDGQQTN